MPVPITLPRWLMQPEVWRYVGFASTIVGLLCYALSSSFNYLFGEWNLLKIFLYSAFSLFICLVSLFAKVCRHSPSLWFKAHSAFLVLTITSIYSFFSDKVVNGKPDAYSLISCAAFAIMSLSLSRQTHCGFEVDLLYFFLAGLIVQLMKIKLVLAMGGIGFSYALIFLRSSLDAASAEYLGVQDHQSLVIDIDSMSMMQQLITYMKVLQQGNSYLTDTLLKQVGKYLESNSELVETDLNFVVDSLPSRTINDLHETVKLMVGVGLEKECSKVYSDYRSEWLQNCLINGLLGLQEIIEMGEGWEIETYNLRRWREASKVALKILFPIERQLCDRVFLGFSSVADLCFTEVCRGATFQLLNLADAVASGSPSADRLYIVVDMFETMRELIPEFQLLFPMSFVNEAIAIKNRLGELGRDIFMQSRNFIFRRPQVKSEAPGNGGLHQMTSSILNFLALVCREKQIVEQILQEYPKVGNEGGTTSLSVQIDQTLELLERKLVAESKSYKDPTLRHFFMMNNRRYIEHEATTQQLETVLSCEWFRGNSIKLQKNIELYERNSWNKVLNLLKLDENETEESMKDKLNLFNLHFEEICNVQSTWFVVYANRRKQMKISIENILLPAYGNFIGKFQDVLGKHAYEYIEYAIFDVQGRLNQLFLVDDRERK